MPERQNFTPLVFGIALVAVGLLLFARGYYEFEIAWWSVLRLVLPAFFLFIGLSKLFRHFTWSPENLAKEGSRGSLLGGLFWTTVGTLVLLDMLQMVEFFQIFGRYWPLLLILFGLGKIIDFYRLSGRMQFRAGEVFGLIFLVFFGLFSDLVAEAHWDLLNFDFGEIGPDRSRGRGNTYSTSDSTSIPAAGIATLKVSNLYGNVQIEGTEAESIELQWTKRVTHRRKSRAEEIQKAIEITTGQSEDTLTVGTNRNQLRDRGFRFRTDLVIKAPKRLMVHAVSGYGNLTVSGLEAPCTLENNRGRINASFITGDVSVTNRFDSINARSIEGRVTIQNKRGSVTVEEIQGDVDIKTDRKVVVAERVQGSIEVENYHGQVRLVDVSGTTRIDAVGSSVDLSEIGDTAVVNNTYRNVTAYKIQKGLELTSSNSKIRLTEIDGPIRIEASRSEISAEFIRAGITIQARGSSVLLNDVQGGADVATSLKRVQIEQFQGPVLIRNDGGEIQIVNDLQLTADVVAENTNGEINMTLPGDSSFALSAQARGGRIFSDFGRPPSAGADQVLETRVGRGSPKVSLRTGFSSIRVKKSG